jgi:plastocyanin
MRNLFRLSYKLATMGLGMMLLVACGSASISETSMSNSAPTAHTASVAIPLGQELFDPFILVVQPGTRVTWQNNDSTDHTIASTPEHNSFLNPQVFSLAAASSQNVSLTFTKPGIYDYFDKTQAMWDATDQRVQANKNEPNFPLAMEGIIWVQGSLSSLPSVAANVIPSGKDDFTTDFLAIRRGGTVSWHNGDTDVHFVGQVTGWPTPINPVNIGNNQLNGTDATPPHGQTKTMTYSTPGLYYYYCSAHADVNMQWHRVQAHPNASEYPIPMEGFLLVVGS